MGAANNGGPAFPVDTAQPEEGEYGHQTGGKTWQFPGMTLRDYFAAHAPITTDDAMLACGVTAASIGMLPRAQRIAVMAALADMRSDYADAMLERSAQ